MRITTTLLSAAIAAGLLVSCSTMQVDGRLLAAVPCFRGSCLVPVTVNDCAAGNFSTPNAKIDLGGPGNGNRRVIAWAILTDGYRFKNPGGLDVKDSSTFFGAPNYPAEQLMTSQVNVTTKGRVHGYGLLIEKSDGSLSCQEYDPWVIE
jgi:hypothetical protein